MLAVSRNNFQPNTPLASGKTSVMRNSLLRQPAVDEISFKSNRASEFAKALIKEHGYIEALVHNITPVTILEKQSNGATTPVMAFLAKTEIVSSIGYPSVNGLAVFSQKGFLLGDIRTLDTEECRRDKETVSNIGPYLRLHHLNASYSDKHKGVGSVLINAAKEESKKLGFAGQLKVYAWNDMSLEKGSPVPFYAKMGFVSFREPSKTRDELVAKYSCPEAIDWDVNMVFLMPENLEKLKKVKK